MNKCERDNDLLNNDIGVERGVSFLLNYTSTNGKLRSGSGEAPVRVER